jgi:hypothetical protein
MVLHHLSALMGVIRTFSLGSAGASMGVMRSFLINIIRSMGVVRTSILSTVEDMAVIRIFAKEVVTDAFGMGTVRNASLGGTVEISHAFHALVLHYPTIPTLDSPSPRTPRLLRFHANTVIIRVVEIVGIGTLEA